MVLLSLYSRQLDHLDALTNAFMSRPDIIPELSSWYPAFKEYLNTNFLSQDQSLPNGPNYNMTHGFFQEKLTQFLVSPVLEAFFFKRSKHQNLFMLYQSWYDLWEEMK